MKKLVLVLVLVLAFSFSALANPFVDVPLNHWAYDSVQSLAAKGVIVGYPDGTFGGARNLTRYELAEATAKALAYVENMDFASAEDVAILEKLAIEFADELASLGVTVADMEATLGAQSEAVAALEDTVAKLDHFFEPVTITGGATVDYVKQILPTVSPATITDETTLNIAVEINDTTDAGIELTWIDVLNGAISLDDADFWLEHDGPDLHLLVGTIDEDGELIGTVAQGLIYEYDNYQEDFYGAWAQWGWDTEGNSDLGTWTMFMDVEKFYVLNIGFEAGDDDIPIGITASYDPLAVGFAASADLSFDIGDDDETTVGVEAGMFYGTALAFGGVASVSGSYDDFDLGVDVYYLQPGFVPTSSAYTADVMGVDAAIGFMLSDEGDDTEINAELSWNYEMDSAFVTNVTHDIGAELAFVIDADTAEAAMVGVTYSVLTGGVDLEAEYVNLPLGDDTEFVLSAHAEYAMLTGDYLGVATLVYAFEDDMTLTVEGRVDSVSAFAPYSAEAKLDYAVAENTDIYVGFEYNDWADDINDWDDLAIVGDTSTVTAGVEVSF